MVYLGNGMLIESSMYHARLMFWYWNMTSTIRSRCTTLLSIRWAIVLVLVYAKQRLEKIFSFLGINFDIFSSFPFRIHWIRPLQLYRKLRVNYDKFCGFVLIMLKIYRKLKIWFLLTCGMFWLMDRWITDPECIIGTIGLADRLATDPKRLILKRLGDKDRDSFSGYQPSGKLKSVIKARKLKCNGL